MPFAVSRCVQYNFLINFVRHMQAETAQAEACEKFESMSACGKEELIGFRNRRVAAFKKRLVKQQTLQYILIYLYFYVSKVSSSCLSLKSSMPKTNTIICVNRSWP